MGFINSKLKRFPLATLKFKVEEVSLYIICNLGSSIISAGLKKKDNPMLPRRKCCKCFDVITFFRCLGWNDSRRFILVIYDVQTCSVVSGAHFHCHVRIRLFCCLFFLPPRQRGIVFMTICLFVHFPLCSLIFYQTWKYSILVCVSIFKFYMKEYYFSKGMIYMNTIMPWTQLWPPVYRLDLPDKNQKMGLGPT